MAEVHHLKDHRQTIQEALELENAGLHDELSELLRKFKGQSRELAELRRDKRAEAEEHTLWPTAVRVFVYHNRVHSHPKAEWSIERWDMAQLRLSRENGLEDALRAIWGRTQDSWYRRNRKTMFDDVFAKAVDFERALSECPSSWQPPPGYEKAPQPTETRAEGQAD